MLVVSVQEVAEPQRSIVDAPPLREGEGEGVVLDDMGQPSEIATWGVVDDPHEEGVGSGFPGLGCGG